MSEITGREALEYLVELGKKLSPVEQLTYDGREYTRQEIKPVNVPIVEPLLVSTLSGLADLCSSLGDRDGFEGYNPNTHIIHVVNERQVQVVAGISNKWKKREVLVDCRLTETIPFRFGVFMGQDDFIIQMLSCFAKNGPLGELVKIAGKATAEVITTSQDDGVSQIVGLRSGAHLEDQAQVKNIVTLRPYRTFREVEQPASEFLVRLQQSGGGEVMPKFALFEADGGAWRLAAMENIARYLLILLPDATVVN